MPINVSENLHRLASIFTVPLYIVGGYVRNSLLGIATSDLDLASELLPDEVERLLKNTAFSVSHTSIKLMTLKISIADESYEYTTFRTDSYADGHQPMAVEKADIKNDALRRDFTVNAIYYNILREEIVDPLNGRKDLDIRLLKTTRKGEDVFVEDGLRLMRLCRFSAELGFDIFAETLDAAKTYAYKIKEISPERIRDELDKILIADIRYGNLDGQVKGLRHLTEIGVTQIILPEITLGIGMQQRKDYHLFDVFEHTLMTVKYASSDIRLAALLHDVGKPYCKLNYGNYHNHDTVGAEIAKNICSRLRYPNFVIEDTVLLVSLHMFNLKGDAKENTVRYFVQKNHRLLDKLCDLKQADYLAGGLTKGECQTVKQLREVYAEMVQEKVPFSVKELYVKGDVLIALSIPESKRSGVLQTLLRECSVKASPYLEADKQYEYLKKFTEQESNNNGKRH